MKRLLALFLCMGLLLLPSGSATAAGLTMEAEAAFDGYFKFGEWLPIFVTIENGGADLTAEIRVSVAGQTGGRLDYILPAELPAGARKRFTLYALPNNFSHTALVELLQNEDRLLSREVKVSVVQNARYVLGAVAAEPGTIAALGLINLPGRWEQPLVINLSLEEIPDLGTGLRLFNTLVLNDVDTSQLSAAQQAALSDWVAGGGRLLLGGGDGAERTLAGLPAALLPFIPAGPQEVATLPGLAEYAGEAIRVPGPFVVAGGDPAPDARILAAQKNANDGAAKELPLIVELAFGRGYVDFIALDLSRSPFGDWAGAVPLAQRLLSPGAAWPKYLPPDVAPQQMIDSQMSYALSNLPALALPSVTFLAVLLAGYIILIGPANYVLLRWRDRLAWAWLTIPALTAIFSGLTYAIGFSLRGGDIIINQIALLEMGGDGRIAESRTYVGIFSPTYQDYDVEVKSPSLERALIRPLGENYDPWSGGYRGGDISVMQGNPARVRGLTVNQWSMQSFVAETRPPAQTTGLVTTITTTRDGLHGQLTNTGQNTWQDVIIILGSQFQKLGDLPPGQTANIRLDLQQEAQFVGGIGSYMLYAMPTDGTDDYEIRFKQSVLDSSVFNGSVPRLNREGLLLLAWSEEIPLTVSLGDELANAQKRALLYGNLPLTFDGTEVAIPPGFSRGEMIEANGNSGECGYGYVTDGYQIYQGTVDVWLKLPAALRGVRPEHLELHIRTDGGWMEAPGVKLYDRTDDEWRELEQARIGANPIEPERFYNVEDASLRVQLEGNNFNGGCVFLQLALEGTRG